MNYAKSFAEISKNRLKNTVLKMGISSNYTRSWQTKVRALSIDLSQTYKINGRSGKRKYRRTEALQA